MGEALSLVSHISMRMKQMLLLPNLITCLQKVMERMVHTYNGLQEEVVEAGTITALKNFD